MKTCLTLALSLIVSLLQAAPATEERPGEGLAPPPLAEKKRPTDDLVPTVKIIRDDKQVIEQYSRAGQVYMVKVIPNVGPAYYYLDTDGDGQVDGKTEELGGDIQPVYWRVAEW